MGRFTGSNAHGHRLRKIGPDHWRLFWTVDRYYRTSNLRHPVGYRRDTDDAGARRFAAKHGIADPTASSSNPNSPAQEPHEA